MLCLCVILGQMEEKQMEGGVSTLEGVRKQGERSKDGKGSAAKCNQ
jgi:hypothetical protein